MCDSARFLLAARQLASPTPSPSPLHLGRADSRLNEAEGSAVLNVTKASDHLSLPTPTPTPHPSLISHMVSVDVKHHVYLLLFPVPNKPDGFCGR